MSVFRCIPFLNLMSRLHEVAQLPQLEWVLKRDPGSLNPNPYSGQRYSESNTESIQQLARKFGWLVNNEWMKYLEEEIFIPSCIRY